MGSKVQLATVDVVTQITLGLETSAVRPSADDPVKDHRPFLINQRVVPRWDQAICLYGSPAAQLRLGKVYSIYRVKPRKEQILIAGNVLLRVDQT